MRRKGMSRNHSRNNFRSGNRVKGKNIRLYSKRGGIRM